MSLLSSLCCLFGCKKEPVSAVHSASDVVGVSVSCGEMDRRYSYSFLLYSKEDSWYFDASCFINEYESETSISNCPVTTEEKESVFDIIERNDSIAFVENNTAKYNSKGVADGSSYGFALTFSDGTQLTADKRQDELEMFFYDLAEKYSNNN